MKIVDQHSQQQITDLVHACAGYWELRGIAQDRRDEMQIELEQHLQQAIYDGKSLEAVVGPNSLAFAEAWARETPRRFSGGFPIVLRWWVYNWLPYILAFLGGVALLEHLIFLSPTFPFTATHALTLVFFAIFGLLGSVAGFFSPGVRTREKRALLILSIYALVSVLILIILILAGVPLKVTLFRWDWPITALIIIGAAVLLWLKFLLARNQRQEQQSSTIQRH